MLCAIVAMSRNRVIGRENRLPWRIPEDMKRFRSVTSGHPVIMGRKTFESIGRPLPDRENRVISRQPGYSAPGITVFSSVERALENCNCRERSLKNMDSDPGGKVFIIGGEQIYSQTLNRIDRIYLTLVQQDIEGDAYFPDFDQKDFEELSREDRLEPIPFSFITLERKRSRSDLA